MTRTLLIFTHTTDNVSSRFGNHGTMQWEVYINRADQWIKFIIDLPAATTVCSRPWRIIHYHTLCPRNYLLRSATNAHGKSYYAAVAILLCSHSRRQVTTHMSKIRPFIISTNNANLQPQLCVNLVLYKCVPRAVQMDGLSDINYRGWRGIYRFYTAARAEDNTAVQVYLWCLKYHFWIAWKLPHWTKACLHTKVL